MQRPSPFYEKNDLSRLLRRILEFLDHLTVAQETYTAGDLVTITDDESLGFARVMSVDGDAATGVLSLEVPASGAADDAAEFLELVDDEWCDVLDD